MEVLGIVFVGTRTTARAEMAVFGRDVLGLRQRAVAGVDGEFFELPDGSSFVVVGTEGVDPAERTVGFLVDDVESAARELRAAGVPTGEVAATDLHRYVHFRAPDGRLYELLENVSPRS